MNSQQVQSAIRSTIIAVGFLAVGKGWVTAAQMQMLGSDATLAIIFQVIGVLGAIGAGVWGFFVHKQTNAVAVVAAMPEVAKVETTATPEGRTLAADVGSTPQAVVTVAPK